MAIQRIEESHGNRCEHMGDKSEPGRDKIINERGYVCGTV